MIPAHKSTNGLMIHIHLRLRLKLIPYTMFEIQKMMHLHKLVHIPFWTMRFKKLKHINTRDIWYMTVPEL